MNVSPLRRGCSLAVLFLADFGLFFLFRMLFSDWLAVCAAWFCAVCLSFFVRVFPASGERFGTLNATLNRLVYFGMAVCPTLPVNLGFFLLLQTRLSAQWASLAGAVAAALLAPFCERALTAPMKKLDKLINEETVSYLFFGVLTTVLNIAIHWFFSELIGINPMISNVIAWVGGVVFAYATNRRFVFNSKTTGKAAWIEMGAFVLARLFSLAVDQGGMALCLYVLHWSNMPSKVLMNVIVIILNYIFSKLFIFRKQDTN